MLSTTEKTNILAKIGSKRVFSFKDAYKLFEDDPSSIKDFLGGKGAGLAQMTASGVNVPQGLTIMTLACREYSKTKKMPDSLVSEIMKELSSIESELGKKLGDLENPLLLSVRSGAKFSMPGMMDTILNLGLNDKTLEALSKQTQNERFAYDSYRRFIQMYSNVVLQIDKLEFEDILEDKKDALGIKNDAELKVEDLKDIVKQYKARVKELKKVDFPQDVKEQLLGAIEAVFKSWNNTRAIYYRNMHKIDHNLGTAVNVQSMVFGNFDNSSGTGVCFTRNPSTGEKELYGEFLINAQGEDVVAGVRTPKRISEMKKDMPEVYKELLLCTEKLEKHYRDIQDIEFTIEKGKLYLLQTRTGKRTAACAIKAAVDLANENTITRDEALLRVEPNQLNQILLPSFKKESKQNAIDKGAHLTTGLNASPGAAIGQVVFDPTEAETLAGKGEPVVLVRIETCPDDIHGIVPAQGVVTSRGGMTSHAAVVARGMGKPCVAGCDSVKIDMHAQEFAVGDVIVKKGDFISIDGSTGEIFKGKLETEDPNLSNEFRTLLEWADEKRRLLIRTNADTPHDAKLAREFGAQGIGLCRTEHMFMSQDRLPKVQSMIMSGNKEDRVKALDELLPMQREDFVGLFEAMDGLPVTIRLLDPPLHEFLPHPEELVEEIATMKAKGETGGEVRRKEALLKTVHNLQESNPMMGLRGCRLGLLYPEINEMQVRAIFEAAIHVSKNGVKVFPEIMIPLVGHVNELKVARQELEEVAKSVMDKAKHKVDYLFGTMIEIPRACLTANQIAECAQFFSFGTNDLTQMTFGYSRDDAEGKFLHRYLDGIKVDGETVKILEDNPFEVLDEEGVGKLMKIAVEYGLQTRPDLKLGICGEHGGEPRSIAFAHGLGLNYVSCSPYRVPVARLAAAQAAVNKNN